MQSSKIVLGWAVRQNASQRLYLQSWWEYLEKTKVDKRQEEQQTKFTSTVITSTVDCSGEADSRHGRSRANAQRMES
ncbi:hypothetical protein WJX79_009587 [Trebouxia sp. C0005]